MGQVSTPEVTSTNNDRIVPVEHQSVHGSETPIGSFTNDFWSGMYSKELQAAAGIASQAGFMTAGGAAVMQTLNGNGGDLGSVSKLDPDVIQFVAFAGDPPAEGAREVGQGLSEQQRAELNRLNQALRDRLGKLPLEQQQQVLSLPRELLVTLQSLSAGDQTNILGLSRDVQRRTLESEAKRLFGDRLASAMDGVKGVPDNLRASMRDMARHFANGDFDAFSESLSTLHLDKRETKQFLDLFGQGLQRMGIKSTLIDFQGFGCLFVHGPNDNDLVLSDTTMNGGIWRRTETGATRVKGQRTAVLNHILARALHE